MILLVTAHARGRLMRASYELATAARRIAPEGPLVALVIGDGAVEAAREAAHIAERILVADRPELAQYHPELWSSAVAQVAQAMHASAVLIAATRNGREYSPRVAVKLDAPLMEDVVSLDASEGALVAERYCFLARATETIEADHPVAVITVKPGAFPASEPEKKAGEQSEVEVNLPQPQLRIVQKESESRDRLSLDEADIVVAGGLGVTSARGFTQLIVGLADQLGAAVAATRAVVDAGWRPYADQVGQTGKTVQPKAYIAVGISGAVQHLSGMNRSKVIVAINKDPDAPIFKVADYGIVGDAEKIVPALIEELRK